MILIKCILFLTFKTQTFQWSRLRSDVCYNEPNHPLQDTTYEEWAETNSVRGHFVSTLSLFLQKFGQNPVVHVIFY